MQKLTLDNFIIANADFETSQYNILSTLQEYENELKQFKLYPVYQYLSSLVEELENVLIRKACIKECSPVRLLKFELPETEDSINTKEFIKTEMGKIWKLIEWGYDTISPIFEEAQIIYDFVEQNIKLMAIEEKNDFEKSGCFLIPNNKMAELNFYKFSNSSQRFFTGNQKSIEADLIESINFNEIFNNQINNIGEKLLNGYPELTRSAVYAIKTDLDLPFNESILPVAKNILADKLSA